MAKAEAEPRWTIGLIDSHSGNSCQLVDNIVGDLPGDLLWLICLFSAQVVILSTLRESLTTIQQFCIDE